MNSVAATTYDITRFEVLRNDQFRFRFSALLERFSMVYPEASSDTHEFMVSSDGELTKVTLLYSSIILGEFDDEFFLVKRMKVLGPDSGDLWRDVLVPVFGESRGELAALIEWEAGNLLETFSIKNGRIKEREIK